MATSCILIYNQNIKSDILKQFLIHFWAHLFSQLLMFTQYNCWNAKFKPCIKYVIRAMITFFDSSLHLQYCALQSFLHTSNELFKATSCCHATSAPTLLSEWSGDMLLDQLIQVNCDFCNWFGSVWRWNTTF